MIMGTGSHVYLTIYITIYITNIENILLILLMVVTVLIYHCLAPARGQAFGPYLLSFMFPSVSWMSTHLMTSGLLALHFSRACISVLNDLPHLYKMWQTYHFTLISFICDIIMLNINHNWSYWLTKSFYICSLFIIITSCHFVFSSTLRLQRLCSRKSEFITRGHHSQTQTLATWCMSWELE